MLMRHVFGLKNHLKREMLTPKSFSGYAVDAQTLPSDWKEYFVNRALPCPD